MATQSARPQYIFGYGSLINAESRMTTVPSAVSAWPVVVSGISRGWFHIWGREHTVSWTPTFLGAVPSAGTDCNGVVFAVTQPEIEAFDERELGYQRLAIDPSRIMTLDGRSSAPEGDYWYYATPDPRDASEEHPLVQSYVDICLSGCLQVEATYPLARAAAFAEQFLRTTTNWQGPWVNDRVFPWRPGQHVPDAWKIDALIVDILGQELFDRIRLPLLSSRTQWPLRRGPS